MTSDRKPSRQIEYLPPSKETIQAYVLRLCHRLAQERGETFADPEVMRGFAEFLYIVGTIRAKHLNRANVIDNDSD